MNATTFGEEFGQLCTAWHAFGLAHRLRQHDKGLLGKLVRALRPALAG
ncbi:hypothetical protein [Bradyrhizobium sp. USDA 10063]